MPNSSLLTQFEKALDLRRKALPTKDQEVLGTKNVCKRCSHTYEVTCFKDFMFCPSCNTEIHDDDAVIAFLGEPLEFPGLHP